MSALDRNIIRNGIAFVVVLLLAAWVKPEAVDAALGKDVPAMRSAPALSSYGPSHFVPRRSALQSTIAGDTK